MSFVDHEIGPNDLQPESTGIVEHPTNSADINPSAIPIIARMCYSPFMKLTHARLTQLLHYDPETGVFTRKTAVGGRKIGEISGCKNTNGYIEIGIDRHLYKAHRVAWFYMTGEWPRRFIDHINGVKDDNRFANLRTATNSENTRNSRMRNDNTSGLKGVTFHKASGKWCAQIMKHGKQNHLGLFDTSEDAYSAYCAASKELHGEFARLT